MAFHSGDDIPISQMRAALLVARYGSMQKAGEDLGLGRSAVWSRIKTLENIVGFKLFEPSTDQRIMHPTPRGSEFLGFCSPFVASYETMLERYVARPEEYGAREVLVASTPNCFVAPALLANDIPRKRGARLVECGFRKVIESVNRGLTTFGIVETPSRNVGMIVGLAQAKGLQVHVFHHTVRRALLRKNNAALVSSTFRSKLNENELSRNLQVCYFDPDSPDWVRDENFASPRGSVIEVSDTTAAMSAIELQDCYLVGCGYCDERHLHNLVAVPLLPESEVLILGIMSPENGRSKGAQELQAAIFAELSKLKLERDANLDRWLAGRDAMKSEQG